MSTQKLEIGNSQVALCLFGPKNHKCDSCGKSFSMVGILNSHIRSVHNNINYECDICEKSFSETGNLKRHFRSVHYGG